MNRDHEGKPYRVIMGRLKGEDTLTDQSFRYPKDKWGVDAARSHCKGRDGTFEAASEETSLTPEDYEIDYVIDQVAEQIDEFPEEEVKEGRVLSARSKEKVLNAISAMQAASEALQALLASSETADDEKKTVVEGKIDAPSDEARKDEEAERKLAVIRTNRKSIKNAFIALEQILKETK